MMGEERATYTLELRQAQNNLTELKQQVDIKERNNKEVEERIQAAEQAVAAETQAQNARKGEIAAVEASRKVPMSTMATGGICEHRVVVFVAVLLSQ